MSSYYERTRAEEPESPLARLRGLLDDFNGKSRRLEVLTQLDDPTEDQAAEGAILCGALSGLEEEIRDETRTLRAAGHSFGLVKSQRNGRWEMRG